MPQITTEIMAALRTSLNTSFQGAMDKGIEPTSQAFTTTVPSSGEAEFYDWLGQMPEIREWIDERQYNKLEEHGYYIKNRKFESTIVVPRTKIEDGKLGTYTMLATAHGKKALEFPDKLSYEALEKGWSAQCFTGQNFFDDEHPHVVKGEAATFSNVATGAGPAWYLLVTDEVINPIVFQDRMKAEFQAKGDGSDGFFDRDEFVFGPRIRCSSGYTFPQLAFASTEILTVESYKKAREAIQGFVNTSGETLGFSPDLLVVPNTLKDAAKIILEAPKIGGEHNTLQGDVTLLVAKRLKRTA